MKNNLAACERAGRVFRLEHPFSILKEVQEEASRCWSDDMDRLAFQAGWMLTDTEWLCAEIRSAMTMVHVSEDSSGRGPG
jgi:hypothetical protein